MTSPEPTPPETLESRDEPARANAAAPSSPALQAGWLLRVAAFAAVAAGVMGVVVAPGMHGNAGERAVVWTEHASEALSTFVALLLVGTLVWGALEVVRSQAVAVAPRAALIVVPVGSVVIATLGAYSMWYGAYRDRLPTQLAVLLSASAAVAAIAGAYASARAPHTRAVAGILFALAFAAIARLGAWELAAAAGERASTRLFAVSRGFATAGVVFESFGQLLAAAWLGTRSRLAGQLGASAALVGALAVTWGVSQGVHSGAATWQSMMHTALADAPGMPSPYGLDAVATFVVPASLLLALAAAAQPRQVAAVVATLALALVSRGAFDAPIRALCAVAAAQWIALASADERAMWRTLLDARAKRAATDREPDEPEDEPPAEP